ncbi:type IV secretion system protein [Candidatus Mesenet endosymbiont of Agriotes lineatus]|uniref:type IV secretion system protein n=1 Tax=Candidatus Mesenet endosymbiont of Agriotes lineatus TaxID=3077948 RepID=UPI0030D1CEE9
MLKNAKVVLLILAILLLNVDFLLTSSAIAAEKKVNEEGATAIFRDTKASNPNCQAAKLSTQIISGVSAGVILIITGVALQASVIGIKAGVVMFSSGVGAITALVMNNAMFFGCAYSFVRHPVLRSDSNDESGGQPGQYKQCKNPDKAYPTCTDKIYQKEDDYFRCIADGDIEKGRRLEPRCPKKEFETVGEYYWPKNRISSSNYIEVCYRAPLGGIHGKDKLLPRELDYGNDDLKNAKIWLGGKVECSGPLRAGEKSRPLHGVTFKAVERRDQICVDTWGMGNLPWFPQSEVGCHMRPSGPPAPMCEKSKPEIKDGKVVSYDNSQCFNWYISPACYSITGAHAKSPFPLTSVVVECLKESLNNLLTGTHADGAKREDGFLDIAQKRLKTAIKAALVLALMLFAIKTMLGGVQHTAELYLLIIKFALVLYFTMGGVMSHYYDQLIKLSQGLSDVVLQAGGNETICNYRQDEYPTINGKNLGYLALWDRLDCRIMFYLGSQLNATTGVAILTSFMLAALIIFAVFFGAQVIICIVALFMVIMIILVAIWMVYLFILSLIALTIIILVSPLFIPMCLFQATKGFFDGWLKEIMTYSLYPVILFAFLSLMFSVFDNLYFGDLRFKRVTGDNGKITFTLDPENACDFETNKGNLACIMNSIEFRNQPIAFGFEWTGFDIDKGVTELLWTKLGMMGLMGFLFYHFLGTIGSLAAELAGNPRANLAYGVTSPTAMMKKGLSAALSARSGIRGVGEKAMNAAKNLSGKGQSKGSDEVSRR